MASSSVKDEYEEFDDLDEDEDEEPGFSGLMVLLMGGLMLGAMVAVVWVAYSHGVNMGRDGGEAPVAAADPSPVKVERAREGSGEPSRAVYDDGNADPGDETVVVAEAEDAVGPRPELENPILGVGREGNEEVVDDAVADRIASIAAEEATVPASRPIAQAPVQPSTQPTDEPTAQPATRPAINPRPEAPAAASGAAPTQPASATRPNAAPSVVGPLSGTHVVQIAALKSRGEADQAWASIAAKLGDFVDGKSPHVLSPTGPNDGFYRLRIGPFASQAAASSYCEGLKQRGQGCMVRSN